MEKTKPMPEIILKFSTVGNNDQHPNTLPDRHKMAGIDIVTDFLSNSSDLWWEVASLE